MTVTIKAIKQIIKESGVLVDLTELKDNVNLGEQGIDSLDMLNFYLLLEEKFDIKIPDEDVHQLRTLEGILEYIEKRTKL